MITVGVETSGAGAEAVGSVARERGFAFPMVADAGFGVAGRFTLPHAVLYDHTGTCIFRGSPLDAEPYVRRAIGQSLLARVGRNGFGKPAEPVADLLERGAPMSEVFTRLAQQRRVTPKAAADELTALEDALVAGGKKVLDTAAGRAATEPVEAYFAVERLPAAYRGTSLEKPAQQFVYKLRGKPAVERELRARPSLQAVQKLDAQLSGREGSFDPELPEFRQANAGLLKQLADAVGRVRKRFPDTRAAADAARIARHWAVPVE